MIKKIVVGRIFFIDEKKRILAMLRNCVGKKDCKHPGLMVPGGVVDNGEYVIDGLTREIKEELGIDISEYTVTPFFIHRTKSLKSVIETHFFFTRVKKFKYTVVESEKFDWDDFCYPAAFQEKAEEFDANISDGILEAFAEMDSRRLW